MLHKPLADLLRPQHLSEYVGQPHLVSDGGIIKAMLELKKLGSIILWGPPGVGKTSLARVLANETDMPLHFLSAINSGVKDIKAIGEQAEQGLLAETQLVFIDEIHRFNKSQQDALLPYVEKGNMVLIGATTENPAFALNNALLSRTNVLVLKKLGETDLENLLNKALETLSTNKPVTIEQDAKHFVLQQVNGDARKLLTTIELCFQLSSAGSIDEDSTVHLSKAAIVQSLGQQFSAFSKGGDEYYDLLSAFHKSVRGSSVDGALFWFARLLLVNKDIVPICRRLLAIASEDIGNADPNALNLCLNAWDTYHRVGEAEGERAVAQAIVYCALAPKSNAVYNAFKQAKRLAAEYANSEVPNHLRNAPTSLAKDMGHGAGYEYAHNHEHAYVPNYQYLPDDVGEPDLYKPSERGLEKKLTAKKAFLRQLDQFKRDGKI